MAKKFEAPGNLQELEADALAAAVAEAFDRAKELAPKDGETPAPEVIEEASAIRDFIRAAKEENAAREQAAQESADLFAEITAEIDEAIPADGEEGGDGEPAADPTETEEVIPGEDDQPAEEEAPAAAEAQVPVAASRKAPAKFTRGSLAAKAAKAAPKTQAPTAETAGARLLVTNNIKQFQAGTEYKSLGDAAPVLIERFKSLPKNVEGVRIANGALGIALPENQFSDTNKEYSGREGQLQMFLDAGNEKRLTGKSLVAAGGWGAPSERSLDFCEIESIEGLFTMPEVSITRGGTEYTKGPVFADILASSTGFWDMTEAEAEAGTELKTSLRPSLPTFEEQRLDAVGVMLEAGLLLRQGWPEVIARHADLLLKAHAYKLAQKKLGLIRGFTGAAKLVGPGFGNALDLLHILELIATGERQRTFMSPNQTIEAVIPHWAKNVIRVDIANRNGVADIKSITDAQIDSEFTARKIKVQWITGDQNIVIDGTKGIALKYPDTVDVLMYPAGTFVAGVAPVISLDTIYDSTNLKKNDYVELFVEQGVLVTNPCGDGLNVRIPLKANGRRAIDNIANDFGTAAV
jgi:hypothetical protein